GPGAGECAALKGVVEAGQAGEPVRRLNAVVIQPAERHVLLRRNDVVDADDVVVVEERFGFDAREQAGGDALARAERAIARGRAGRSSNADRGRRKRIATADGTRGLV